MNNKWKYSFDKEIRAANAIRKKYGTLAAYFQSLEKKKK